MAIESHITDPSLAAALETSQAAREQALLLVDLVAETSTAAGNNSFSTDSLADISKQQKILNTNLAQLRGLHRSAHFRARETKGQTAEARHEVDVLHLQLQNLYYEQRHLEGEISACESFECVFFWPFRLQRQVTNKHGFFPFGIVAILINLSPSFPSRSSSHCTRNTSTTTRTRS